MMFRLSSRFSTKAKVTGVDFTREFQADDEKRDFSDFFQNKRLT